MTDAFPYDDIDRAVWEREFASRLPARIYDAHSHAWRAEEYRSLPSDNPSLPFVVEEYPVSDLRAAHARLFPGREVGGLIFGSGERGTDFIAQNAWLAAEGKRQGYETLMYAQPDWEEAELERQLAAGHLGLKPYWNLAGDSLDAVDLSDMIPPAMVQVANRRHAIVMTHIPKTGRLADPANRTGLRRLCEAAPEARFVLAHLGRSYFPQAMEHFDELCDIPNLWVDCSMVQDWEVIEHALAVFPRDRVLFGLDLPIAQEKGKLISVNGQRHFLTKRPHAWSVHVEPGSYEVRCTSFAYEIIRALLKGADRAGLNKGEIDALFWDNAQRLIAHAREGATL